MPLVISALLSSDLNFIIEFQNLKSNLCIRHLLNMDLCLQYKYIGQRVAQFLVDFL